jgi:hypothetical protein
MLAVTDHLATILKEAAVAEVLLALEALLLALLLVVLEELQQRAV